MPTKPLDRLMYAQGGLCYFCNVPLPKAEASVEHLVPSARAGSNSDDNCVACCKAFNALLGSMSLKEKIKVVLNQKGQFKCPNGTGNAAPTSTPAPKSIAVKPVQRAPVKPAVKPADGESTTHRIPPETIAMVISNLKSRGNARPRSLRTLGSTIKALATLKLTDKQVEILIQHLLSSGKITVVNEQVAYKL
jgi:hypothetical protein